MSGPSTSQDSIAAHLAPHGLHLRGSARFRQGEGGPLLDDGRMARTVLLIGNVGGSMWPAFGEWRAGDFLPTPHDGAVHSCTATDGRLQMFRREREEPLFV